MHPATRARIAAGALAAAALALWALDRPGAAIVLLASAGAVLLVAPDRSVTREVAHALADARTAADTVEAMALEGRGVVAPYDRGAILFCPARDVEPKDVPRFDGTTRIVQRPPAIGMFVTAPGQGLLDAWTQFAGPVQGGGVEQAAATLKRALPALGVGQRVRVEAGPRVRITYQPWLEPADRTRAWAGMGGDPVASLTGLVLCLATQQAWRLAAIDDVEGGVRVEWEP